MLEGGLDAGDSDAIKAANAELLRLQEELRQSKEALHQARVEADDQQARAAAMAVSLRREGLETPETKTRREGKRRGVPAVPKIPTAKLLPPKALLATTGNGVGTDVLASRPRAQLPPMVHVVDDDDSDDDDLLTSAGLGVGMGLGNAAADLYGDMRDVGCNTEDNRVSSGSQTRMTGEHLAAMQKKIEESQDDGTVTGALAKWSKAKLAEE